MADITADTIRTILDIARAELYEEIQDVHGVRTIFSTKPLHQVKAEPPAMLPRVDVTTLAGFAELVRAKLDERDFPADFIIHIEDECTVALKARESDDYGRRTCLVKAKPVPFEAFKFGQWHDQEAFSIALAARFAESPDKAYVLNMASSLTNDATTNSEDDGFTQRATVKAGLRMKEQVTIKPRVDLAPYRTFPEVDQPVSSFVLRARTVGDTPALMLVEADGGRWKLDAIQKIADAMRAFDLNIPIIA